MLSAVVVKKLNWRLYKPMKTPKCNKRSEMRYVRTRSLSLIVSDNFIHDVVHDIRDFASALRYSTKLCISDALKY